MFEEIRNTLSDICSGALPASELPGYLAHLCRKVAWLAILVIFAFGIGYLLGT